MATHSSLLAWRLPWTEEPGGLQSTGPQSAEAADNNNGTVAATTEAKGPMDHPHGRRSSRKPLRRPRPRELRALLGAPGTPEWR